MLIKEVNIEKQPLLRFLIIGKKRLPDPSKRGLPHWGFVDMVTTKIDDIKTALQGGISYFFYDVLLHLSFLFFRKMYTF